jgi:hypothetical protein
MLSTFIPFFSTKKNKKKDVSQEQFVLLNTFPAGLDVQGADGAMCGRSIVAFDDPEIEEVQKSLWNGGLTVKEQRGLGVLFGMLCGDSIGAPLEFSAVRYGVEDFTADSATSIPAHLWQLQSYNRFRWDCAWQTRCW